MYKENSPNCYFSLYLLGWETLVNLKKLLDESMLKEIDQDCIILNEEQADELYGGAEWGYYGNCSFGNCH